MGWWGLRPGLVESFRQPSPVAAIKKRDKAPQNQAVINPGTPERPATDGGGGP